MPEQVFLQNRNVVLEFPDGTPDDVIKKTIKREYPMTGEEVAGQMVVNPDWFNSEMTLDEYERYREWKSEQDMSVGDFAGVAATALGQVGGEVLKSLGQLATSPIDSISEVPTAFSLGTKDIWNLGKQIKGNLQKTSGTYAEFLDGRQDTASLRKSYRSKLAEDMKSEQEMVGYFSKERERIISESDNPDFVRGAANVLDPSVFFGGFLGKNFAKAASKAASGAAGKAASFTGSKIAGAGDIVAGVTDRAADALSTGFTRATGVTPETGKALAYGSGVGVGVASAGAPIVGGLYAGTKGAQVGGRVLAEAGEGLQRGIGREGFFGGAAARLEGKQGYGLARALSVADPVLEYGAQAAGGAVAGGALGMGLGALADGWDGAASGLGGGIALGGIGGGVARGIEGVTGVAMREKRARDVDAYLNNMQGEQRVLLENYIAKAGKDQAATILDVSKIFTGALGDASVRFVNDPSGARGFVPDMKTAEGTPTLVINLAKADSHVTIGHELWHGLTKMEQMQPMADQIRTELAGMWSDKKLIQEGLIPEAQLERYFNDYVKKLKPSEREAVMNTHGKDRESRAKYIVDEIAAEQMSMMITGKKGKQYDRMMRGFDTPLRNLIDETVLNGNKGIVTSLVGKLSNIGVTPGKSMLFPDMQAASPTVSAMMRDMIRTRKNLGELVEATDKTITTAIRKQDFSKHQAELEKLNMLKDDGKGGRVMKDDKDIAAEEQASDLALREVLAKGGPDGMRIEAKQDERGTIVGEEIRGSRFSPEQISEIQKNSTILPSVRQNVEAFNNAVENGLIIDMVYYAATRKTKSRLTGKYTSKYSSGIKRSKRDVLPYGLEITNAGNIVVRAIDWTKMWTDTANMSFAKKLGLWENDHKLFLNDFKQYLTNLSGDRKSSQSLFGKDKADFMQGLLMSSERGGSKYARTFRLDRMDGLTPTGEKAMMSEQAYQLSKQRFMPDDGTVRAEPDQTFKLGNEGVARFMPANDRVDLADYADRNVIALAADRMGIGVVKVGPTGAKRELSIPAQGGRGFMNIFNGGGWAFSDQATASRFLKRLKEDADENGNAVVGITVQSQINHLKNQTGQLAYVEAMQAAIDAGAISKRAADSQVRAMSDAVLASEAASIKQTTKQKFRKIRNISGLERAVKNKVLNFADMEPLLKQMQRKALPIKEAQLKEIGMTAPDIARDIADPELADIPFGSVVALLEVNVKQTPEKNNFHHSYPYTVHGNALGYLNRFHNIADLSTDPRIRNKHGVSAQPLQTVMPVMDNILKTVETKEGIPADPAARFMPDDSSYLDAANRGDTATAQRMVDQAAKAAGYGPNAVYHGTTHKFNVFKNDRGNVENDFGVGHYFTTSRDDVSANYAGLGPDLTQRIELRADALEDEGLGRDAAFSAARSELAGGEARVITAYVKTDNPAVFGKDDRGSEMRFESLSIYDEAAIADKMPELRQEIAKEEGVKPNEVEEFEVRQRAEEWADDNGFYNEDPHPLLEAVERVSSDLDGVEGIDRLQEILSEEPTYAQVEDVLRREVFQYATNDTGGLVTGDSVKRVFQELGHDGIIDRRVNEKFGTAREVGVPMEGMREGDTHVIVFDPNQIKSADPITYDDAGNVIPLSERFQSGSDDIRYMPDAAMDALPSGEGAVEKRVAIPRRGRGGNVPEMSEIRAALSDDRKPKVGVGDKLKAGDPVGLRIDIPAFERTLENPVSKTGEPTYAVSVHGKWKGKKGGGAGTVVGYENLVRVKNPVFMVNEKAAAGIRGGKAKSTIATVEGAYVKSKAIPSDISNWTQVGMNPKRHSYFYDRATGEPVVGGTEALSVGGTVFVKDAEFGSRGDFRFMPDIGPAPQRADDGWIFPNGKFLGLGGLDHEGAFNSWANKNRNNSYANQVLGLRNDRVIKEDGHPDEPVRRKDILKAGIVRVVREGDGVHRKIHAQGNMNRTQKAALERMAINSERSLSHDPSLEQHGEGLFYGRSSKLIYETPKKLRFNKERESMRQEMVDAGLMRFMPDASVPGAEKNSIGWSMILSKAGKWRVYDPSGALAGIAGSKAVAERIFRTKYKRELRRSSLAK